MVTLKSPWAAVDKGLLDSAARVLPLSGDRVELMAGKDSLGLAKYDDDWCVISTMKHDDCPWGGGLCMMGSCMNGRVVEDLLRRLIASTKPKQMALF